MVPILVQYTTLFLSLSLSHTLSHSLLLFLVVGLFGSARQSVVSFVALGFLPHTGWLASYIGLADFNQHSLTHSLPLSISL